MYLELDLASILHMAHDQKAPYLLDRTSLLGYSVGQDNLLFVYFSKINN